MANLIYGNVYRAKDIPKAAKLYSELKIFPTPFKGIYYVPYDTERKAQYVTDPHSVVFKAAELYLKTDTYYYGLNSALYYLRIIWNAIGIDIINEKLSRKINKKIPSTKYWRGKVIAKILCQYSFPIRFHKMKGFSMVDLKKKGSIAFSNLRKTKRDAIYLSKKGDKVADEVRLRVEKV